MGAAGRKPHDSAFLLQTKEEKKKRKKASWLAMANELTGVCPGNIPEWIHLLRFPSFEKRHLVVEDGD